MFIHVTPLSDQLSDDSLEFMSLLSSFKAHLAWICHPMLLTCIHSMATALGDSTYVVVEAVPVDENATVTVSNTEAILVRLLSADRVIGREREGEGEMQPVFIVPVIFWIVSVRMTCSVTFDSISGRESKDTNTTQAPFSQNAGRLVLCCLESALVAR